MRSFTGKKQFNVVLKNYGSEIVTFRVNPGKVLTTATVNNTLKQVESPAILTASQSRISLSPNEEKSITFTLDATMVTNDFVEGFIQFESRNPDKQPNIHFAYMGYAGDWNRPLRPLRVRSRHGPRPAPSGPRPRETAHEAPSPAAPSPRCARTADHRQRSRPRGTGSQCRSPRALAL